MTRRQDPSTATSSTGRSPTAPGPLWQPASALVLAAMLLFAAWFSAYSIRLHDAHRTHKADLGQIDLAIWNTAHGRFVQEIKDDQVSTRLTDHVEPIFLLVAPIFWLWDDVRALLILQAAALAAGAWPIYLLAREKTRDWGFGMGAWPAALFALAYLLMPILQAAAVAEFHALALAPALIAWALWAVEARRWGQFVAAAALLMAVQEGMALLAAGLGAYALARGWQLLPPLPPQSWGEADSPRHRGVRGAVSAAQSWGEADSPRSRGAGGAVSAAGAAILALGLIWFYVATFVIIPHHAAQAYGLAQTPYVARYGELGDSFGDVLKALITRPWVALRIAAEPPRAGYLIGLFAATGFLALLGPEIVLLSAPLLLANLFSSFPMQYFGELHYSAALAPYLIVAGLIGLRRFRAQAQPLTGGRPALILGLALLVAGALIGQVDRGYTPIGREYARLGPGWPAVTAHERLLGRFARQIPPDAALSTTASLYPHFSHRPLIYQFPWLGQADWALLDVTAATDRHPADIRREALRLLETGWGVVDAADGYLLLARGRGQAAIPDAFYDFARATADRPLRPLACEERGDCHVAFEGKLKLLGYDLADEPKWRRTVLRFYFQPLEPLPADTRIILRVVSADGETAADTTVQAAPALLWYPPAAWRPGETVVVSTLPLFLPAAWAPAVAVEAEGRRLTPQVIEPAVATAEGEAILGGWERQGGWLAPAGEPREAYPASARFTAAGWSVRLTHAAMRRAAAPGRRYLLALRWAADEGAAPADYRVFVHLRDAAGRTIANGDATPTWFAPRPVNRWPRPFAIWSAYGIPVPADAAPGEYALVIGWYDPATGKRLSVSGAEGNATATEFVLGTVVVDPFAGPRPDLCCLLAPDCCASQE